MKTDHTVYYSSSSAMDGVADSSVGLVVTSPPYPMIEMWDDLFTQQNSEIGRALSEGERSLAFELMHRELDPVWEETYRVLIPGGFACINIGDATRTLDGHFMLYPNHARILTQMIGLGFTPLPEIIWRKQSNAPNKFMGSGMLPAGAYVTQEHEYILIFRKGDKRVFKSAGEKAHRRESAIFWEERNQWFSDLWTDLLGTRQETGSPDLRKRSAAFPFELPFRLISMYSQKNDIVLDPYGGLGTTMLAAMATGRSSISYEIDSSLAPAIEDRVKTLPKIAAERVEKRLTSHRTFVKERINRGKEIKHHNSHYDFPVVTAQEKELQFELPVDVRKTGNSVFEVVYTGEPEKIIPSDPSVSNQAPETDQSDSTKRKTKKAVQLSLFD